MKTYRAVHLFLLLFCLAHASHGVGKFLVLDYQEIGKKMSSDSELGPQLKAFEDNNGGEIDVSKILYLIVPSEATQVGPFRTWAVVKGACSTMDREYLQPVSIFDDTLRSLWQMVTKGTVSSVSDSVVLDDEDVKNLIRLAWLNRESSLDSAGAEVAKLFNAQFLQSESRVWFLMNSPPGRRLLIVKGLTTSQAATVYLCLPDHKGPTPFFEVYSPDRLVLSNAMKVLRSDTIPAAFVVNLKFMGDHHLSSEVEELEENIDVHFRNNDGTEILAAVQKRKRDGESVRLEVTAPREILSSKEVRLIVRKGEFKALDPETKQFTDAVAFRFPESQDILHTETSFTLLLAKVGHAPGFQCHGPLSSTARVGDLQIPFDTDALLERYKSQNGIDNRAVDLFEAPKEFFSRLKLSFQKSEDRQIWIQKATASINATKEVREAVWRQVEIGLSKAGSGSLVLLVKSSAGPVKEGESPSRADVNHYFSLMRSFIDLKLHAMSPNGGELLETERQVSDPKDVGTLDIIVVPSEVSMRALEAGRPAG